jgi:hypothetical protein
MSMTRHQRGRPKTQIYLTPRPIIRALGPFGLDPCAAPDPRPFPTADTYYTEAEGDGLMRSWEGSRAWLNPPFNDLDRWIGRLPYQ